MPLADCSAVPGTAVVPALSFVLPFEALAPPPSASVRKSIGTHHKVVTAKMLSQRSFDACRRRDNCSTRSTSRTSNLISCAICTVYGLMSLPKKH